LWWCRGGGGGAGRGGGGRSSDGELWRVFGERQQQTDLCHREAAEECRRYTELALQHQQAAIDQQQQQQQQQTRRTARAPCQLHAHTTVSLPRIFLTGWGGGGGEFSGGGGSPPTRNLQFPPSPKRLPNCVLEVFFSDGTMNYKIYITETFFSWTINTGNYSSLSNQCTKLRLACLTVPSLLQLC